MHQRSILLHWESPSHSVWSSLHYDMVSHLNYCAHPFSVNGAVTILLETKTEQLGFRQSGCIFLCTIMWPYNRSHASKNTLKATVGIEQHCRDRQMLNSLDSMSGKPSTYYGLTWRYEKNGKSTLEKFKYWTGLLVFSRPFYCADFFCTMSSCVFSSVLTVIKPQK